MTTLPITSLFVEEYTWPRDHLDASRVEMFTALLKENEPLPPIEVVAVGDGTFVIADGVHRFEAAMAAGMSHVDAVLVSPNVDEDLLDCAFRRALETACLTALPLTRAERKYAVERLLSTQGDFTHRAIARLVGVAHSTVDRWAEEVAESANSLEKLYPTTPSADDVAMKLVRMIERLEESRTLFDLFGSGRIGRHLANAFAERYGNRALPQAKLVKSWLDRTVATLESGSDA
jgi:ParB-like chromosome segregation protein Spo0J